MSYYPDPNSHIRDKARGALGSTNCDIVKL